LRTLELSEARWQTVLASARDPIIRIDPGGTVTFFNQAAEGIFGHAAAEVIGKNVKLLMPPPYTEQVQLIELQSTCIVQCPLDALYFGSPTGDVMLPDTVRRFKLNLLGKRLVKRGGGRRYPGV
jgi:hypothetical protein